MSSLLFILLSVVQQDSTSSHVLENASLMEAEPIKFGFNTIGWYALFSVVLIILVVFLYKTIIIGKRPWLKTLIKETKYLNGKHPQNEVKLILKNLKYAAIKIYGRQKVANLSGSKWFDFLDKSVGKNSFSALSGIINDCVYLGKELDYEEFTKVKNASINWMKKHA